MWGAAPETEHSRESITAQVISAEYVRLDVRNKFGYDRGHA